MSLQEAQSLYGSLNHAFGLIWGLLKLFVGNDYRILWEARIIFRPGNDLVAFLGAPHVEGRPANHGIHPSGIEGHNPSLIIAAG